MIWFLIGAGIGAGSLAWSLNQRPIMGRSFLDWVGGFGISALMGALIIGTPLWLIFG